MAVNFNKSIFVGTLTRDFKIETASNGSPYTWNGLAINRKYKTSEGQKKEEVVFVNFALFGNMAENAQKYVGKGNQVLLEGRISNRKVEERIELNFIVERIQFITFKKQDEEAGEAPQGGDSDEVPF